MGLLYFDGHPCGRVYVRYDFVVRTKKRTRAINYARRSNFENVYSQTVRFTDGFFLAKSALLIVANNRFSRRKNTNVFLPRRTTDGYRVRTNRHDDVRVAHQVALGRSLDQLVRVFVRVTVTVPAVSFATGTYGGSLYTGMHDDV